MIDLCWSGGSSPLTLAATTSNLLFYDASSVINSTPASIAATSAATADLDVASASVGKLSTVATSSLVGVPHPETGELNLPSKLGESECLCSSREPTILSRCVGPSVRL